MGGGKNRHRKKNSKKGGGGVSIFFIELSSFQISCTSKKMKAKLFWQRNHIVQKIRQKSVILQVCVSGSKKVLAHLQVPLCSNLCSKLTKTCHWVKTFLNPEAKNC